MSGIAGWESGSQLSDAGKDGEESVGAEVEVSVINRPEEKPLGAGEAAQGPTAAAIAHAIYRARGNRIRQLPIRPEKITG